jgi:hypothetical protein
MLFKHTLHSSLLFAILVFLASLTIHTVTLAPDLLGGGGDFSTFQTRAYLLEIEAGVFGHPLWVIPSHPFTLIPPCEISPGGRISLELYMERWLLPLFS